MNLGLWWDAGVCANELWTLTSFSRTLLEDNTMEPLTLLIQYRGERVGAVVVPSPCTTKVPGSIPVHDRALCAFGYSRSILALAGFLRELRFPPAFKIGE